MSHESFAPSSPGLSKVQKLKTCVMIFGENILGMPGMLRCALRSAGRWHAPDDGRLPATGRAHESAREVSMQRFNDLPRLPGTGGSPAERLARAVPLAGTPGQAYVERR